MVSIDVTTEAEPQVACAHCWACCCRLEVILHSSTGVPEHFVDINSWGASVMARFDDGWCAALDRDSLLCTIYNVRPAICRDFEMGGVECIDARETYP